MAKECIFCDPKPESLLFSGTDGKVLVGDPVRPGHVMVGTTEHAPDLHDVAPEQAAGVMRLASHAARVIVGVTGATKTYVVAIGEVDRHFHVHLLPRWDNDPAMGPYIFGQNGWASFLPPTPDRSEVTASLRVQLSSIYG
jgi:diadenosine tetraphosphate (Ap4A) HIT family hydrolase